MRNNTGFSHLGAIRLVDEVKSGLAANVAR
jgi:hypothetical protein